MKKTLSIILTLCMILAICSFNVSAAPQGTAITSEAEFLAMKEGGAYYLANDITVTQSYEALFTGVFDGNGKTVTVTGEPMFLEFCGTGMNLTIEGTVVADHAKDNGYWARGAFACMASGDEMVTLYNITNNANVTGFDAEDTATYAGLLGHAYTGGIVGAFDNQSVGTAASFTVIKCVNNGNVSGYHCTGGITGIFYVNDSAYTGEQTLTVTNCTNNGTINGINTYTGGIVGRVYYCVDATFTGCINNGAVCGYGNTGGIIGHTTNTSSIIRGCQNNGAISNDKSLESTAYAGGIIGYAQGTKSSNFAASEGKYASIIEYCINTGTVEGHKRIGGIVGSSGADGAYGITHTRYCINTGSVTNLGDNSTSHAQGNAGGIQGYAYGSGTNEYAYVTNCINTGMVEAKSAEYGIAAHFLGYISSNYAIIADNHATGTLTSAANKEYALGWNNAGVYDIATSNNKIPATNTHKLAYENGNEEGTFSTGVVDESYLLLGTAIKDFNAAYKAAGGTADILTMNIDGTFHPNVVVLEAAAPEITYPETAPETTAAPETTKAPETEAPVETTEAPVETTEAPVETEAPAETAAPAETNAPADTEPAKSGCGSMIAGGAVLAIICLAAVPMVKKNRD